MLGGFSSRRVGVRHALDSATASSSEEESSTRIGLLSAASAERSGVVKTLIVVVGACTLAAVGCSLMRATSGSHAVASVSRHADTAEAVQFLAAAPAPASEAAQQVAQAVGATGTCAEVTDDCSVSGCCNTPGFQCYEKNSEYSGCRGFCNTGNGSDWTCREIGSRAQKNDGVKFCSWASENCGGTQCCNDANMKCFTKDDFFAACHFNPQDGWDNKELGGFRGWNQIVSSVPEGQEPAGTSLYCITVQAPDAKAMKNRPATHDGTLIGAVREQGLGIFACDASDVFMGAQAPKAEWESISNTDIFINMWMQVKKMGKFWHHDWTVKADPDAVFFPDRLKNHLSKMRAPKDKPIYIKNSNFKFGFMGSLEIFSEKAMETFYSDGDQCTDKIGHTGGEDFYIMTCMDALGVGSMADATILDDKYTRTDFLNLTDTTPCANGWTSAFHPYKDIDTWFDCHQRAIDSANAWADSHAPAAAPAAPAAPAPPEQQIALR